MNTEPRYQHDCSECTFIKSYRTVDEENIIDQYVHVKERAGGVDLNIVERYGNYGPDYTSWTLHGVNVSTALNIIDPYGDEAAFEPMAGWEMQLIMEWPVSTIAAPLPISGDVLARSKFQKIKKG